MINKVLVITRGESDILKVLGSKSAAIEVLAPGELPRQGLSGYSSIMLIGGDEKEPLFLSPAERVLLEQEIKKGKRIFAEYCGSIGSVYFENPATTRFHRLIFSSKDLKINGIERGDILDDQCGSRIKPHAEFCSKKEPILSYMSLHAHKSYKALDDTPLKSNDRALWFEKDNVLICGFRLANFIKGRFSPIKKVNSLVSFILSWSLGEDITLESIEPAYKIKGPEDMQRLDKDELEVELQKSAAEAVQWINNTELLINEGKGGVYEGFGTEIYPDGSQRFADLIRADCAGEIALTYFLHHLSTGDETSLQKADNLTSFIFNYMQVKDQGPYRGMIRWTQQAFETCYQDDVARAVNGHLLRCIITGSRDYLHECREAMDFLVSTTGIDGTRVMRTDICSLSEDKIKELNTSPGNLPSAHYNGYYLGSLLLLYKLTGEASYREVAVKGLTTIMSAYPNTTREQSQTEEYCRLILPLAWLYWVTGEEKHKDWLYRVCEDLQQFRHSSGAYLEWDEGYKATMRNVKGDGECSLLAENGDMVVDLLYSNNWLPLAFIQAYYITGDEYFKRLWLDNAAFLSGIQVMSSDKRLNGAWARGFDVEYLEYFGSPADAGWGPWAMESGWTIGEIAAGLYMGLLEEKLKPIFHK